MYYPFFISMFFIYLLIHIPVSLSQEDGVGYSNCSQPFNCGKLQDIKYPFWGNNRAEYCGLPEFELNCNEDSTEIEIQSQSFHILDINQTSRTLQIATNVTWDGNCPSQFTNISLPITNSFTYYGALDENITLSYGCPSIQQLNATNQFRCSDSLNYFWVSSMGPTPQELSRCNKSIVVPVLQTLVQNFTTSQSTMQDIVKEGFHVEYPLDDTFCLTCTHSRGLCGYNSKQMRSTCICSDASHHERCPSSGMAGIPLKIGIGVGVVIGILIMTGVCICCIAACICCKRLLTCGKRQKKAHKMVEMFLKNCESLAPTRYYYQDIKKITNSFKDKIGEGGYGCVYKGKLIDGRVVAVKLLNKVKGDGHDFMNEVASISKTSHVNVVSLLGFCFNGSKRALIYEFMTNGSLEKFIFDQNPQFHLGWETLYKIAVGVARGLEYLHRGCNTRILHLDIKPHNILLDEHFVPKVSDFGLAKLCLRNESIVSMLDARGTAGYIAPEVFNKNFGGVSHKSDVYSYGMMVLEIVGGRKNIDVGVDRISEIYFPGWIYKRIKFNEDLGLHGVVSIEDKECAKKMILVALWCIQANPMNRPTMTRVVEMLEGKVELQAIPPQF